MLRTTTLAAFIVSLSGTGTAQVFTMDNAIPPPGTYPVLYAHIGDAPGPVDTVGTGLVWDISTGYTWGSEEPFTYTVGPASASPYAGYAPGANWHMEDQAGEEPYVQYFYRLDADSLIHLGVLADYPGFPTQLEPSCEGLQMTFPATIGTEMVLDLPDWCPGVIDVDSVARRITATGQLVTPLGTFTDVVLVRTSRCGYGWLDPETGGGGYACQKEFAWYQLGNLLYPLMQMFDIGEEYLGSGMVYLPLSGTGINEVAATGLSLFPNPATDRITLQHDQGLALGHVAVHAVDGRVVQDHGRHATARAVLSVDALAPGLYHVVATYGGVRRVHRMVKG